MNTGKWQYKTEKEYLCVKDGEERGFTASEFKAAQAEGWEKQYPYKVGKKKVYMASSVAQCHGYVRMDKHPKKHPVRQAESHLCAVEQRRTAARLARGVGHGSEPLSGAGRSRQPH